MGATKVPMVRPDRRVLRGDAKYTVRGTVETVARSTGIPAHVVRYYARIGLVKPRRDPHNGYMLFTDAQCCRLLFIRNAQRLGYTLRDISAILHDADRSRSPCSLAREVIQRRIVENRQELAELDRLQRRMEQALRRWGRMPDNVLTGDAICHLIESNALNRDRRQPRAVSKTRTES